MLAEDHNEGYHIGTAVCHDEDSGDVALRLMPQYREWADVFCTEESDKLPEHSGFDHHINLQPGTKPPFCHLYPCSESEVKTLRVFLNKALASSKIT